MQPGACVPVLATCVALLQPAWKVLNEGTIAQPVEDAEVGEAVSGTSFSGQITSSAGYCLVGTAGDQEEHGSFELPVKTVAVV